MSVLAGLAGAVCVLGLAIAAFGWYGTADTPTAPRRSRTRLAALAGADGGRGRRRLAAEVAVALVAGLTVLLFTGWPVAALAAPAGILGLPRLARLPSGSGSTARLEALEEWTRRLADTIRAGAGIEHALTHSAGSCPAVLRPQVTELVARLRARQPTEAALRAFADELADPTADLIVAALILSASRRGRGLATVLSGLATTVAEEVTMRRGVEADRAKPRTTARAVTAITLIVAGGLVVLDRAYVAPFGSLLGQLVLALVIAIFTAAFWWLRVLAAGGPAARFLVGQAAGGVGTRRPGSPAVGRRRHDLTASGPRSLVGGPG